MNSTSSTSTTEQANIYNYDTNKEKVLSLLNKEKVDEKEILACT